MQERKRCNKYVWIEYKNATFMENLVLSLGKTLHYHALSKCKVLRPFAVFILGSFSDLQTLINIEAI